MDAFESWWAGYWKPMQPEVMNQPFKEVAKAAWDARSAHVAALEDVAQAAAASVKNPAWCGVCDEDVLLEQALRRAGLI